MIDNSDTRDHLVEAPPPTDAPDQHGPPQRLEGPGALRARLNDDSSINDESTSQAVERTPAEPVHTEVSGQRPTEGSDVQERLSDSFGAQPKEPAVVLDEADRNAGGDDGGGARDLNPVFTMGSPENDSADRSGDPQHLPTQSPQLGGRLTGNADSLNEADSLASIVDSSERDSADPSHDTQEAISGLSQLRERLPDDTESDLESDSLPEPLDNRLQGIFDLSEVTPAGRSFYESNDLPMRAHAQEVSPQPGKYTVDMHGDTQSVYVGQEQFSADDLGLLLQNDPNWNEQPVFLMSCDTGSDPQGFGQQLADKLDTDVWAPTELAFSRPDGTVFSSSAAYASFGWPPDGKWVQYHPSTDHNK